MFDIRAGEQPRRLLHAIRNGGAQENEDALAIWAWGSLSLTAMRPAGRTDGELDIPLARAPEWNGRRRKIATPPAYCFGMRHLFANDVSRARERLLHPYMQRLLHARP